MSKTPMSCDLAVSPYLWVMIPVVSMTSVSTTSVDPTRRWTYQISKWSNPNLTDTELIRYQTYSISNLSDTELLRYCTYLSDTELFRYWTHQKRNLISVHTRSSSRLGGGGEQWLGQNSGQSWWEGWTIIWGRRGWGDCGGPVAPPIFP